MRLSGLLGAMAICGVAPGIAFAEPLKVAAFEFEFYDTSAEGEINGARTDEGQRTEQISAQARDFLKGKGIELVDIAPAKKDVDAQSLRTCGACSARFASALGADYSFMGYVQKVSNLILNVNVEVRNARTGEMVRNGSADIRGNTEESWSHGLRYLMRYTILKTPLPDVAAK